MLRPRDISLITTLCFTLCACDRLFTVTTCHHSIDYSALSIQALTTRNELECARLCRENTNCAYADFIYRNAQNNCQILPRIPATLNCQHPPGGASLAIMMSGYRQETSAAGETDTTDTTPVGNTDAIALETSDTTQDGNADTTGEFVCPSGYTPYLAGRTCFKLVTGSGATESGATAACVGDGGGQLLVLNSQEELDVLEPILIADGGSKYRVSGKQSGAANWLTWDNIGLPWTMWDPATGIPPVDPICLKLSTSSDPTQTFSMAQCSCTSKIAYVCEIIP